MKFVLCSVLLSATVAFSTPNSFGAFTHNNKLYVTLLGDCNAASVSLVVDSLCNKNRASRNLALECGVELNVVSTEKGCLDNQLVPKVFSFDISKEAIAPEAIDLELRYRGHSVKTKINK